MTRTALQGLVNRVPQFMHPELDRVETLEDLQFQVRHEIDLAESGELEWTAQQFRIARRFAAAVRGE